MYYAFDGSKEGLLTTLVKAFSDEEALVSSKRAQLPIGAGQVCVETDVSLAKRTEKRLLSFDSSCMRELDILLRSGEEDNEQVAFAYLRVLAKAKHPVGERLAVAEVFRAVERAHKVRAELHRMRGFLRFMETESGGLYAPCSPDNDICDLLAVHFRARLPHFPFVVHDVARKKAAVYDGKNIFVAPLERAEVLLAADELGWQELWKGYYQAVNIPSRERLKQMRGYMPARYWKFLTERS